MNTSNLLKDQGRMPSWEWPDEAADETAAWFDAYKSLPARQRETFLLKTIKEPMAGGLARSDGLVDGLSTFASIDGNGTSSTLRISRSAPARRSISLFPCGRGSDLDGRRRSI